MPASSTASTERSPTRVRVCSVAELQPGGRKIVRHRGREVGVFNVDGAYYALANRCPHRGAPICLGWVRPLITCDQQRVVAVHDDANILRCPWHQWEFDMQTGQSNVDTRMHVRTYRVETAGDDVQVYI
jgi:nitrite reductase/ring-hydroxylating ferredoxin subunit